MVLPNRNAFKSRLKCPISMSGCRSEAETPVAKLSVCSQNSENVGVSGAKLEASGVRDQLAVVDQV